MRRVTSWLRLVEKTVEIDARRLRQRLAVLAAQLRQKRQRVGDERRLAGLAAVRNGGEEGGVGFDQQAALRQPFGGRLQIGGIPEGHDPRNRDIEAEIERLAREIVARGKAMDDARISRLPHFLAEQPQRVGLGLARVDDDRQAGLLRRMDVAAETVLDRKSTRLNSSN